MKDDRLIFGCGYIGLAAGVDWLSSPGRVRALTRSNTGLRSIGIDPILGDVLKPETLTALPEVQTVLYAIAIDRKSGASFRDVYLKGLENVLKVLPRPGRFLYISSTSVYGQKNGEEIDEDSPTEPTEDNGKAILEAEKLLRSYLPEAVVLRFAGIYGPGRVLRRAALERGDPLVGDADKWLNLIYRGDAVRAIRAAEAHAPPGSTFCVSDNYPVTRREFYTCAAEILNAPPAKFEPAAPMTGPMPHEGNRRIRSAKLLSLPGMSLACPDYRVGLKEAVRED